MSGVYSTLCACAGGGIAFSLLHAEDLFRIHMSKLEYVPVLKLQKRQPS